MKANCSRCGTPLNEIHYVEPDYEGYFEFASVRRPPLCKPCWEKAVKEADARVKSAKALQKAEKIGLDKLC